MPFGAVRQFRSLHAMLRRSAGAAGGLCAEAPIAEVDIFLPINHVLPAWISTSPGMGCGVERPSRSFYLSVMVGKRHHTLEFVLALCIVQRCRVAVVVICCPVLDLAPVRKVQVGRCPTLQSSDIAAQQP